MVARLVSRPETLPAVSNTMSTTDFSLLSIDLLRSKIRGGELSAREVTKDFLARIESSQPRLSSYTCVDEADCLAQADEIDRKLRSGVDIGALGGIPVSVKDIVDVAGLPTTCCSKSEPRTPAAADATVVENLRKQGAVIIGKVNCHEFAFGGPSFDLPFPPARNPWNPEYFPGGSSSGSGAAVAAGLCKASVGTDTAGSIRVPSAHCGVVGLKPTYNALSTGGVRALSTTMDHVGPLAATVRDCRSVFEAMAGGTGGQPDEPTVREGSFAALRVGVPRDVWGMADRLHPDVLAVYNRVVGLLEGNAGQTCEVRLPSLPMVHAAACVTMMGEVSFNFSAAVRKNYNLFGNVFRARALLGECIELDDYLEAAGQRARISAALDEIFEGVDIIVLPISINPPGLLKEVDKFYFLKDENFNILANFAGIPSLSLPCGMSVDGLPIGMQLLGRRGAEARLLDIGEGLERLVGFERTAKP